VDDASALADALQERGLRVVSGGTDNHCFVLDMRPRGLTGKAADARLGRAGITVSKSMVPGDPEKPWITSGVRMGTAALATRAFEPDQMPAVADLIVRALELDDDAPAEAVAALRTEVRELARRHPMP